MSAEPGLELSLLITSSHSHQSVQNEETFVAITVMTINWSLYLQFFKMQENSVIYLIIHVLRPDLL